MSLRYILSDEDISATSDVFMLMEYSADIGPDTSGPEGDEFYCLGKFYAPSLSEAKSEMEALKNKYPWLKKDAMSSRYTVRDIYVDNYNEYFDHFPEDEDDIDMNPSAYGGVEYNVFADLETLIEYLSLNEQGRYWNEDDDEEDVELPFNLEDEPVEPGFEYLDEGLKRFGEIILIDPDYKDIVEDYGYDIIYAEDYVYITIIFYDGYVTDTWNEPIANIPRKTADSVLHYFLNKFYRIAKDHQ